MGILILITTGMTIGVMCYNSWSNTRFIEENGLYTNGIIKDVRYLKSEYTHRIHFTYSGKMYESSGTSQQKHVQGDTIRIRFNQNNPAKDVVIID